MQSKEHKNIKKTLTRLLSQHRENLSCHPFFQKKIKGNEKKKFFFLKNKNKLRNERNKCKPLQLRYYKGCCWKMRAIEKYNQLTLRLQALESLPYELRIRKEKKRKEKKRKEKKRKEKKERKKEKRK